MTNEELAKIESRTKNPHVKILIKEIHKFQQGYADLLKSVPSSILARTAIRDAFMETVKCTNE